MHICMYLCVYVDIFQIIYLVEKSLIGCYEDLIFLSLSHFRANIVEHL